MIEKNLLAIAAKDPPTTEEKELLDVSVDIIRALTLSTLRRLSDGIRKGSVVRLLAEADIIKRLKVNLEDADLHGAKLALANLSDANLSLATLIGADLRGANLSGANLNFAHLGGANLRGAHIEGANLSNATLRGAKLYGAKLRHTILSVANLTNADLSLAKLIGADLIGANLTDTDLSYTDLSYTNLYGADLIGAKGLTKEQLETAYLCKTTLPEGIDMDPNRDCGKPYGEWLSEKMKALIKEREAPPLEE